MRNASVDSPFRIINKSAAAGAPLYLKKRNEIVLRECLKQVSYPIQISIVFRFAPLFKFPPSEKPQGALDLGHGFRPLRTV